MSDVMIAGVFTAIGAVIGFLGSLLQSIISASNNKKMLKLETKKEIELKRYHEKECLYSDIISFLPQLALSVCSANNKVELSKEHRIKFNSFKARLLLYSTPEICDAFYETAEQICRTDGEQQLKLIEECTKFLLQDYKKGYK